MISRKRFSVWIATVFVMTCFVISCDESIQEKKGMIHDPSKPIALTSFFPDSGRFRHKVILSGENFGSDPSKIRVYFNKKKAAVIGSSGNEMYVIVPRVAEDIDCEVAVAVGNDSAVYVEKFRYNKVVMVTTVAGNGARSNRPGNLASATISPTALNVDNLGNIIAAVEFGFPGSPATDVGIVRVNEEEDLMEIILNQGTNPADPNGNRLQGINVDRKNNMIYSLFRRSVSTYVVIDLNENWIPREKIINWEPSAYGYPTRVNQYAGYNPADGCMYVRYYDGHFVRIDPRTSKGTVLWRMPERDNSTLGIDFDPKNPDWCYITGNEFAPLAHGLYRLNIKDPAETWERLNVPTTRGHRDGPIEQALFDTPFYCRFDEDGNLYICDYNNSCIRKYNPESGLITTVTGIPGRRGHQDGGPDEALFNLPYCITIAPDGAIYIADRSTVTTNAYGNRIRKISIE